MHSSYVPMLYTYIKKYIFWFNKLKFGFFILEDYAKKSAFFLSPREERTVLAFSLCVSYSTVNQFTLGSLGRNKGSSVPVQTYTLPTQSVSWNCTRLIEWESSPCHPGRDEEAARSEQKKPEQPYDQQDLCDTSSEDASNTAAASTE